MKRRWRTGGTLLAAYYLAIAIAIAVIAWQQMMAPPEPIIVTVRPVV